MKLNVSDIQHFSTGDGPGIRTTVFLKGCNLHCPWCHNPETISPKTQTAYFEKADKTRVFGHLMTVDEILKDVIEDAEFYRASGGGITVSGGEPLLQADGVEHLLSKAKQYGLHTVIDTAGCVPFESLARVAPFCDLFYFDYKSPDPIQLKTTVGGDEELIYTNLKKLILSGSNVRVRIPLIPGFNTDSDTVDAIAQKLLDAGAMNVDLLPFHRMAGSKYSALGVNYKYSGVCPPSSNEVKRIASRFGNYFKISIEK